jgi:hypothetical protein
MKNTIETSHVVTVQIGADKYFNFQILYNDPNRGILRLEYFDKASNRWIDDSFIMSPINYEVIEDHGPVSVELFTTILKKTFVQ